MKDIDLEINFEGYSHQCIQENRGNEIWMYCPICKDYVRKFDAELKPTKLLDTGFNHTGNIKLTGQTNMN